MWLLDEVRRLPAVARDAVTGSRRRRRWVTDGRTHLELRSLDAEEWSAFGSALERELALLPNVSWAEVNSFLRRLVVDHEPGAVTADQIEAAIARAEAECGVESRKFAADGRDHPADREALDQELIALGTAALGVTFGLIGRVTRIAPPSVRAEIGAIGGLVAEAPPLRAFLEQRYRVAAVDLGLSVVGAVTSGIAAGPVAPIVDAAHRVVRITELRSRQDAWARREAELFDAPGRVPSHEAVPARPVPVPAGPAQLYIDRAWRGAVAVGAVTMLFSRAGDRVAAAISATLPKAARLGPDAFAAQLGRVLAERDVVVLDPNALRLLDRVDVVVLEGDLLMSRDHKVDSVHVVGDVTEPEARRRATVLFDPDGGSRLRQADWELRPAEFDDAGHEQFRRAMDAAGPGGAVSTLVHRGERAAFVATSPALAPGAAEVLSAARRAGLRVVVLASGDVGPLFRDVEMVEPECALETVRTLQREGRVVAAAAAAHHAVLVAADCSLGLVPSRTIPWGADMVARESLADVYLLVMTTATARRASRQSATLALSGAGAALFLAFGGLVPGSVRRATIVVNVAAAVAIANSTRLAIDLANRPIPAAQAGDPWHALEPGTVLARLGTTTDGLSTSDAERRSQPAPRPEPLVLVFARAVAEEFSGPLTPVLAAGAALSVLSGAYGDATLIFVVMGVDALIGGVQRFRTQRSIARLGRVERGAVRVRRDGEAKEVDPSELVVGDIVELRPGDVVPADLRVLGGSHLELDESTLTGESVTVRKGPEAVLAPEIAERASMIYEGTSVAAGDPVGAVVAVGHETEARRSLLFAGDTPTSGVEARLRSLTAFMVPVSVLSGAGVVAVGLLRARPLRDTLGAGVSLAVAAVPEGLPLLATVAQLGAARRLSARNTLVRNPRAVEALGRVDVVCADKTGTLTVGEVRLQVVSDLEDEASLDALAPRQRGVLAGALRAGPATNAQGSLAHPTDRAFVEAARLANVAEHDGVRSWARRHELPFAPARGYHATSGDDDCSGALRLDVKGAPEIVLPRCARMSSSHGTTVLDDDAHVEIDRQVEVMARRGLRVLAVAEGSVPDRGLHDRHVRDLTLLGLVGLNDPARPTAAAAIGELRRAGIEVVMITGDHPSTAAGIAADIDLLGDGTVLTGRELDAMNDADLDLVLESVRVFARVTPAHKVRIVSAFQRSGRTVAMTGDGANDAPAIRLANVGIALGEKSTPAAREAADVVVTDERIETIVDAVVEGRAMWASVRDAVAVLVGGNAGELAFTLFATVVTGSTPLNARQLLVVNLLTDGLPAMAIALRRPRSFSPEDLIAEGPDASLAGPLTRAIAIRGVATASGALAAYGVARVTGTAARASTVSLVALVGTQLAQTLVVGGRDPLVAATTIGSGLVLAGLVQTPGISQAVGCRPIGPFGWIIAMGAVGGATLGVVVVPRALEVVLRKTELWR
jgi:cation-transporting ATPase I